MTQGSPGCFEDRSRITVIVILPVHDLGIIIIVNFLPVAVNQVGNDSKHSCPKIVDQLVKHRLLIFAEVRRCEIESEAVDSLESLAGIDPDTARRSRRLGEQRTWN